MTTATIKLPKNYKKYFKSTEDITQLVEDEIERQQDAKTKVKIETDPEMKELNILLKEALRWA